MTQPTVCRNSGFISEYFCASPLNYFQPVSYPLVPNPDNATAAMAILLGVSE